MSSPRSMNTKNNGIGLSITNLEMLFYAISSRNRPLACQATEDYVEMSHGVSRYAAVSESISVGGPLALDEVFRRSSKI